MRIVNIVEDERGFLLCTHCRRIVRRICRERDGRYILHWRQRLWQGTNLMHYTRTTEMRNSEVPSVIKAYLKLSSTEMVVEVCVCK